MTKNTAADNFYNTLKDDPLEIVAWARLEIKEYEKLIALIEQNRPADAGKTIGEDEQ